MSDPVQGWKDDLLERKQYADFLTTYLEKKCVPGHSGMVLALDAPWGLGKSFFISHWASDLRVAGRAVVTFDAWENDSAQEPAISFMAELRKSLKPLYAKVPMRKAAKKEIERKTMEVVTNLRRATVPALTVMGKAVLKKVTGVAVDEVLDAARGTDDVDSGAISEAAPEALEKGLDAFFEKALQGHVERLESVKAFRQSLEELLAMLGDEGMTTGPLYVFIDELDRCRPDYAIKLLEGIKHLFSVKGVAFVFSTNLEQLGNAVGAVYGPSFDGFRYLKRFFDFEYELPEPTRRAYINARITGTMLSKLPGISGLDPAFPPEDTTNAHAFSLVAEAMRIDLRSLDRIVAIAEAAASGAASGEKFIAIWLFFLAALRHLYPADFLRVSQATMNADLFRDLWKRILTGPNLVPAVERTPDGHGQRKDVELQSVLSTAYGIANTDAADSLKSAEQQNPHFTGYPLILYRVVMAKWNNSLPRRGRHPIARHAELVRAAGHIRT